MFQQATIFISVALTAFVILRNSVTYAAELPEAPTEATQHYASLECLDIGGTKDWKPFCGGVVINQKAVLTAAHCFTFVENSQELSVRVGSKTSQGGTLHLVSKKILHANYSKEKPLLYDIAIVQVKSPFPTAVKAITLPTANDELPADASMYGFGLRQQNVACNVPEFRKLQPFFSLKQSNVNVMHRPLCAELMRMHQLIINKEMICAKYSQEKSEDLCNGEGGSPLIANGKVVGILAWEHGCGTNCIPGIYTSVSAHLNWITQKLNELPANANGPPAQTPAPAGPGQEGNAPAGPSQEGHAPAGPASPDT